MSREAVLKKLNEIICEELDDMSIRVQEKTVLKEIPGWDSFAQINFVVSTEDEFSIKFSLDQISQLEDIGEVVDFILLD